MLELPARPLVATATLLALAPITAGAQVDYRNLDDGRPIRVADAYPIERYGFELSIPYRLSFADGTTRHRVAPRLEYGVARNAMIGVGLDLAAGGQGERSHGGASLLWNVRRETRSLPAFSLALEASGGGFESASVTTGVLTTRSFGLSRLHANLVATIASPTSIAERTEPAWWAGVGWDYTLFRTSTLMVVDVTMEQATKGAPVDWAIAAGVRRQITPTLVFHGGVAQALQGSTRGTELNVGFSHAFGVAGLMRGGR